MPESIAAAYEEGAAGAARPPVLIDSVVLEGKLAPPPLGFPPVLRPRLLTQLSRAVATTPVTLLSGPAGAGKTVLAASWLHAQANRKLGAWLSLEDSVALRLATAPLTRGTPPEQLLAALAADDGSVAQYLSAEVLTRQPAGGRRFPLRISVTDQGNPGGGCANVKVRGGVAPYVQMS